MVIPPNDKGKVRVFVYGTLKQKQTNHIIMESTRADFLGYDIIEGDFALFDLGAFPALQSTATGKSRKILGQTFAMDDEGLAALDHFEGHPGFYRRRKINSVLLNKRVWVYFLENANFMNQETNDITDSGIWQPLESEIKYWENHKAL